MLGGRLPRPVRGPRSDNCPGLWQTQWSHVLQARNELGRSLTANVNLRSIVSLASAVGLAATALLAIKLSSAPASRADGNPPLLPAVQPTGSGESPQPTLSGDPRPLSFAGGTATVNSGPPTASAAPTRTIGPAPRAAFTATPEAIPTTSPTLVSNRQIHDKGAPPPPDARYLYGQYGFPDRVSGIANARVLYQVYRRANGDYWLRPA